MAKKTPLRSSCDAQEPHRDGDQNHVDNLSYRFYSTVCTLSPVECGG